MVDGKKSKLIARLQPKYDVMNPKVNEEKMAPRILIDPNQESCSLDIGPVVNGVEFDIKIGVAGDSQPFC